MLIILRIKWSMIHTKLTLQVKFYSLIIFSSLFTGTSVISTKPSERINKNIDDKIPPSVCTDVSPSVPSQTGLQPPLMCPSPPRSQGPSRPKPPPPPRPTAG